MCSPFKDLLLRNKLRQENLSDVLSIEHTSSSKLVGTEFTAAIGKKDVNNKRVSWAGSDGESTFPKGNSGSQLVVSSLNSHESDRNQDSILRQEVARRVDRNASKRSKRKLRAKVCIAKSTATTTSCPMHYSLSLPLSLFRLLC